MTTGPRKKGGDTCGNGADHDLVNGRGNGDAQEVGEVRGNGVVHELVGVGCGNMAAQEGGRGVRQRGHARPGGERARQRGRANKEGAATGRTRPSGGRNAETGPRKLGRGGAAAGPYTTWSGKGTRQRGRARREERCVAAWPFTTWSGGAATELRKRRVGGVRQRGKTCDEHHFQPPGHQLPLRYLSGVIPDVCIVPAALSNCSNTATPLVRLALDNGHTLGCCFLLQVFCGNVLIVYLAPSPGNHPRQPMPIVVNAVATTLWVESAMILFLRQLLLQRQQYRPQQRGRSITTFVTKPWTLHAYQPVQHHHRLAISLRDEGPASTLKGLASPPTLFPQQPPPRSAPYMYQVTRLSKPDPFVLAMVLRCGCEEAKTSSPTGRLHSTSSTDEQRYLPKTTATARSFCFQFRAIAS